MIAIECVSSALRNPALLAEKKKHIYLSNDKGERRELVHLVPESQDGVEAVFFFPGLNDKGEPLLTSATKKLIFHFDIRISDNQSAIYEKVNFDIQKIIRNGEVVF